jgi:hypothetical protein
MTDNNESTLATARASQSIVESLAKSYDTADTVESTLAAKLHKLATKFGLSSATIAQRVGLARARVAFPDESDAIVMTLSVDYAPSTSRITKLVAAYKFAVECGVQDDKGAVTIAVKFLDRTGNVAFRDDIRTAAKVASEETRVETFIVKVRAALVSIATPKPKEESTTDGEEGSDATDESSEASVPVLLSVEQVAKFLTDVESHQWFEVEARTILNLMDGTYAVLSQLIDSIVETSAVDA